MVVETVIRAVFGSDACMRWEGVCPSGFQRLLPVLAVTSRRFRNCGRRAFLTQRRWKHCRRAVLVYEVAAGCVEYLWELSTSLLMQDSMFLNNALQVFS